MPLPKRRSSSISSFTRTSLGRDRLPSSYHDGREEQVDSSTNPASIAWAARSGPPTLIQAKLLRLELLKVKADLEWQCPECASWWDIEPGVPPQVAPAYDFLTHQGIVPAKWVLRESG